MDKMSHIVPALFIIMWQVYCAQGDTISVSGASSSQSSYEATIPSSSQAHESTSTINTESPSSSTYMTSPSPTLTASVPSTVSPPSSTTMTAALSPSSSLQNSVTAVTSTLAAQTSSTGLSTSSSALQNSTPSLTSALSTALATTGLTQPSSSRQFSNPSSLSVSSVEPSSSGPSQPSSSVYPATGFPTIPPTTQAGAKKFIFSFKINNKICSVNIRENNVKSSEYQSLASIVLAAVNNAFRNDPYYRGSRIVSFDCGSVIPFVEISKNESVTNNIVFELKPVKDMVENGSAAGLTFDSTSFSSNPIKSAPNLYIILDTKLSHSQFCVHKSTFKDRFAAILVSTDGQSFVNPAQIVVFGTSCNDQSVSYNAAKISFYVTQSPSDAMLPDTELTHRAYKLIKQFIEDGTTWRLSAAFDDKVKSVELAGKDKIEDTAYSELTIVLIGMGATFGLLLTIIIIILVLIHLRKKENKISAPLTIRNEVVGLDNTRYEPVEENDERMEINIDGHDYEYPEAAPNEGKKEQPAQVTYQELKPATKEDTAPPVSYYQPLSADEEQKTSVIVEPEESTGYSVSVLSTKPEAKDLTADELARRKDLENQLKLEFESLEYDMPSSNIYASSLMAKNRLSTVIPKPETRVLLKTEDGNPDSDYINASFVTDIHQNKKYIITQGPLQKTTDDFWRMIYEQNTNVIVMLTPLVQEGMEKCYQYWPPDSVPRQYGDIRVHLSKKELKPDFTVTTMELSNNEDQREIVLFRYMSWPENDVPERPRSFVDFLLEAKKANQDRGDSTFVVLCSNGVGMSAVFSAVANGIESFDTKKAVDIYSIVKGLRSDRAGAIQHFDQYKFVYQALYEYSLKFQDEEDPFANKTNITSTF